MDTFLELLKDSLIILAVIVTGTLPVFILEQREKMKEMFWEGKE